MHPIIQTILLIIGVVLLFNLMIFVHELGHFLAGRWRGLYVDRFQIWFGKPIWKKKINGVEWGIGWIPAGGFVSLPQLAPMDAIEGEVDKESVKEFLEKTGRSTEKVTLPPIKPLDKIIVAFAGPFFSFLLALAFAVVVWVVGKPGVQWDSTTIGFIDPESPAAASGLVPGDRIIAVDGQEVTKWAGNMEGLTELIMLSENPVITLTVDRPGHAAPVYIESAYAIKDTKWYERRALRQLGVSFAARSIVEGTLPGSPAETAGLKKGDVITHLNGRKVWSFAFINYEARKGAPLALTVQREGEQLPNEMTVNPVLPANADKMENPYPMMGIQWGLDPDVIKETHEHPRPFAQIAQSLSWMKITLEKIAARGSSVSVEHLSGPVGIGTQFYNLLKSPDGWALALWFAVVLNINLAVLNLLPLPVVDGGHIVLGFAEMIRGREVSGKPLEFVQTAFVFVLLLFFLFVTAKDVGDLFGKGGGKQPEPKFVINS